jgi:hypothetical protein
LEWMSHLLYGLLEGLDHLLDLSDIDCPEYLVQTLAKKESWVK